MLGSRDFFPMDASSNSSNVASVDGSNNCGSCRILGSAVFFTSSGYMVLEALRTSARSTKSFYVITAFALAGLGSYRLAKVDDTSSTGHNHG